MSRSPTCVRRKCAPPPRQTLGQAFEDASIVYGHRVLRGALRDDLPAIDNSWGSYGRGRRARRRPRSPGSRATDDASTLIGQAYAKWQGFAADERSPLGQAGILREEIAAITGRCRRLHVVHVALPHRPWMLTRTGRTLSFEPELIHGADDPATTSPPHGVPAAQHAGRCRRHSRRRARRSPAFAAELGGHDARRDVRPRHQPDGTGHRPDGRHRPTAKRCTGSRCSSRRPVRSRGRSTTGAPRPSTCCPRSSTSSMPTSTGRWTATRCTTAARRRSSRG